ncbi:MAG TPA: FdhF/YdeP family oxidoreductase [Pyrinomonadaceae bacterium]|jgi:molybdopterin-dependent oxidoreductase alpha subunit
MNPETNSHGETHAEIPDNPGELEVGEVKETAAGITSITQTMKYVYGQMGVVSGTRALLKLNQKGGIDCQSCAWADPEEHRTFAEFCENGAKAMADEGTSERAAPELFARYSVAELSEQTDQWLNRQGRLTHPMFLAAGATHYEPISWENAFQILADELNSLASPDEAVFYTSGRTSNEAAFLYQLFARQFGTNNMPDCSNMCHESTSVALSEQIGLGKASVRLEDLENTDLIIIIGQNPGTNAPRMMNSLQQAKRNGARIIAINPLPEAGLLNFVNPNPQHYSNFLMFPVDLLGNRATQFADLHLALRIGGDMAILKGMMKILLEEERANPDTVFKHQFIAEKTSGFEEFINNLDAVSWKDILEQSGLTREQINEAAGMYRKANRVITCWAMGVTQHRHAVATIEDIVNLHLLRGNIGRQGAGLLPVRGHSNVQGDRTMGIWEQMNPKFRANLEKEFDFKTPEKDGFDTVESIKAMHAGRAKIFFAMGGNFLQATPDTRFTAEALQKCSLTALVLTKLNRSALVTGRKALILPCLGRSEKDLQAGTEQFVSTENTMLQVQMSRGIFEPASEHLRSETWIVGQLAKAVFGAKTTVDWDKMISDYDHIRDSIARVAAGFENYNEKIRKPGGFYLPNPPREGSFPNDAGKALFKSSELHSIELKTGELLMTTIRAHDQFNTTIYEKNDRYRGIFGSRRVILMNEADIAERNLQNGQLVDLTSRFEDGERRAEKFIVVSYPIPRSCAATYFPETNVLVPVTSVAKKSNCPTSKLIIITVKPHLESDETVFSGKFEND